MNTLQQVQTTSTKLGGTFLLIATVVSSTVAYVDVAQAASFSTSFSTGSRDRAGASLGSVNPDFTWNYTGNHSDPRYQTYFSNESDVLTGFMKDGDLSSNNNYGSDVPSGTPDFQGFVYMFYEFYLPEDATNISLDFKTLVADDRVVLSINDNSVYGSAFSLPAGASENGQMMQPDLTHTPQTFNGNGWEGVSFNDTSLFKPGQKNILGFLFNNTFSEDVNAPAKPLQGGPDRFWFDSSGTLSWETPDSTSVPEPSSILGLLAVLLPILGGLGKSQIKPSN